MKASPNILIIVTDQQNIDTIAAYRYHFSHEAYGCHWLKTPNLDRLVEQGYSFLESHSCNPVSCPARSTMWTGRYSTETGLTYNNIGIDKDVPNMGQWFEKHSNYDRVYCGKWHAGGAWNYPDVSGNRKVPGFETLPVSVHGTGDFNDFQVSGAVRAYIQNHSCDRPFLVVAGLMNPHDICYWAQGEWGKKIVPDQDLFRLGEKLPPLPPNFNFDFVDPDPRSQQEKGELEWKNYIYDYLRMVEKLDQDVGRMLEAVDSRKDETLVVFTADHGEGAARHRRVSKWHPFEHSVKIPLIYYLPGTIRAQVMDTDHLVSQVNLLPTICDFAGIPDPSDSRGVSLRSILVDQDAELELNTVFSEFRHIARVVRKGDFKYVKYYEYSREPDKPFVRKSDGEAEKFVSCVGSERYREDNKKLLFNIKEDPWETVNLCSDPDYLAKVNELETSLVNEFELVVKPGTHYDRN
jgi:arylsulfatase A-like enzyme